MNEFTSETEGELWNTEDELLQHYRKDENYQKLKRGEVGGNLIYKYKSKNNNFDCLVPVSGGKDGSYVSYILKHKYGMLSLIHI